MRLLLRVCSWCIMSKVIRGGETRPSFFDIGLYIFSFLAPIFFLGTWNLNMAQGLFFIFGVFALLGLSFMSKRKREYNDWILGFLILWSLTNVFIHSFRFSLKDNPVSNFMNFAIMSEGFIYILCGVLLFWLIVNYKNRFNIVYPILAINIFNFVFAILQKLGIYPIWKNIMQLNQVNICGMLGTKSQLVVFSALSIPLLFGFKKWLVIFPLVSMWLGNSFTGVGALFLGTTIYLYKIRNRYLIWWLLLGGGIFLCYVDLHRFAIRPHLWFYTLKEIIRKPIMGWGFDNSMMSNKIFQASELCFRHNDYLNIARDQGLSFLIVLLYGIWKILRKSKIDLLWLSIIILMISCFVQYNFYYSRIAAIGIIMLALKKVESYA